MAEPTKSHGGGNLKYILGGVVLLAGAGVLWTSLKPPAPAPSDKPAPPPPPPHAERVNPMAEPDLIIEEQKDAGQPEVEQPPQKPRRVQREVRGEWECEGDLARTALQKVINGNRSQVRNCYERRLKVNNVLQGELKLKIKIGSNGQVAATALSGSLRDNEVFGCVRSLAQKWSFPPPSGGHCAVVQIPFQFSPKQP